MRWQAIGNSLTDGAPAGIKSYCADSVRLPSELKTDRPPWPLCFVAGATIQATEFAYGQSITRPYQSRQVGQTIVASFFEKAVCFSYICRSKSVVIVQENV
jgi:hypothetical protein